MHQTNGWYGNIYETALSANVALLTEVSLRRMGLAEKPKQLFTIAGLGVRVLPGVRLTVGGGYTASSPYGLLPADFPTREYNVWYQLQLAQHAGAFDFSHRYRLENRWTHDVIRDGSGTHSGSTRYSNRFEYQRRATHPFKSLTFRARPLLGFAADEVFFGLAPSERRVSVEQNRVLAGVGIPLSASERVEFGIMQQGIANTHYRRPNSIMWCRWCLCTASPSGNHTPRDGGEWIAERLVRAVRQTDWLLPYDSRARALL